MSSCRDVFWVACELDLAELAVVRSGLGARYKWFGGGVIKGSHLRVVSLNAFFELGFLKGGILTVVLL